jgi:urease accessory protein
MDSGAPDPEVRLGEVAFLRLLQLASPALPIGAFAYSQGLEQAVELGWVRDEATARGWIFGLLGGPMASLDVAVLIRLHAAFREGDVESVSKWSAFLVACRETAEFRAEEHQLGTGLARVLKSLGVAAAEPWIDREDATYATLFALAGLTWGAPCRATALAFLFAWTEAQVGASTRLIPLGQTAAQRIVAEATATAIPAAIELSLRLVDEDVGFLAAGQVVASALHETQYTRLFRS